jgi:hypothetical protein
VLCMSGPAEGTLYAQAHVGTHVQRHSGAVGRVQQPYPAAAACAAPEPLTCALLMCRAPGLREPCHRLAVTLLSQRGRVSALHRMQRRHRDLVLGVFLSDNEPPGECRVLCVCAGCVLEPAVGWPTCPAACSMQRMCRCM